MQTYNNIYHKICSYENLFLAYKKARKGKSKKDYVLKFEESLENNIKNLQKELVNLTYYSILKKNKRNLKIWKDLDNLDERINGWKSHAFHGNSYNLIKRLNLFKQ